MKYFKTPFSLCILFFLLLNLTISSCSDEKDELAPPLLTVDLEGGGLNIPVDGLVQDIRVTTNVEDWQMTPVDKEVDWCRYNISKGEKDVYTLRFIIDPSEELQERKVKYVLTATGCNPQTITITQLGLKPTILLSPVAKTAKREGEEFAVTVTSNVEYDYELEEGAGSWLTITKQAPDTRYVSIQTYLVKVDPNLFFAERTATISFVAKGGIPLEPVILTITQEKAEMSVEDSKDVKLKVKSAELSYGNTYSNETVDKTIDGDYGTQYSSKKSTNTAVDVDSVVIVYEMEQKNQRIDYIKLTQRANKDPNSVFCKGTIWVRTEGSSDWAIKEKFEVNSGDNLTSDIQMENVESVKLCLYRNPVNVALAEFECFQRSENVQAIQDCQKYFTDGTYSMLKPGVTPEQIKEIKSPVIFNLATELSKGTYEHEYRVRTYHSCKSPKVAARELSIGDRSIYDNPTGIYLEKDVPMIVFVGTIGKKAPILAIADYRVNKGQKSTINLKQGINVIHPNQSGNGYIQYWTDNDIEDIPVKIHFCYGPEIGFWDKRQGHTNKDWDVILKKAQQTVAQYHITNAMMDVLGDKVHLINTINSLATYISPSIEDIVSNHDEMLMHEYTMMGLKKYNAIPKNRFLGARSWEGNPTWNGTSANFPNSEQAMWNVTTLRNSIWVFAHEFGHGNQLDQMKGAGWTEVTNNLYSTYVQYQMCDRNNLRLEHEVVNGVRGGRFSKYLKEAFVNKKTYLQHSATADPESGALEADPFVSLVPLWQMTLYFMLVGEEGANYKPDFWADVHWEAIQHNTEKNVGQRYVNFMKRAIDASGLNLCKFFTDMGLLREMDQLVSDYSVARVVITADMVQQVKSYAQDKPEPASPVMGYISANSLDVFKGKLRLVKGSVNAGVTIGNKNLTISHSVWKNAVAFEVYSGNKLVEVCIAGTGSVPNNSTVVPYPDGATCAKAVGYDGERAIVYGKE